MSTQMSPPSPADPNLDSFVLRFVRQPAEGARPGPGWHGIIRHVQSSRERAFNRWEDAVKFINLFIDITAEESVRTLELANVPTLDQNPEEVPRHASSR